MATLYKLTDENNQTRAGYPNACTWGPGITHSGTGEGDLCGPGYIHAYEDPLLAVLLNPIHANFNKPKLWKAEGEIEKRDGQLKCGCVFLTTVEELQLPVITTIQRVAFGILCALEVYEDPNFVSWALGWLSGSDRSAAWTARAAWVTAGAAARAAAEAAARAAAEAAEWAARAAAAAVEWAAWAGWAAHKNVNLIAIARQAMEVR